jgi:VanZ like family
LPEEEPNESEGPTRWPTGIGRPLTLTLVVGALTLAAQLYPFDFQFGRAGDWLALPRVDPIGLAVNLLLFVPLGLAEFALAYRLLGPRGWIVLIVAVDAAVLALIGESAQVWLPTRDSSMIDLVANTLGGAIGAMLAASAVADETDGIDD